MDKIYIDINCDVGEGIGNEANIFPFITSCSVACGGHAGDSESMRLMVKLAKKHKVKLGAHPSYPDKENFGRVSLAMHPKELSISIQSQIEGLKVICDGENINLHHIKPHGALYNDITADKTLASNFLEAIERYKSTQFIYVPPKSVIEELALKRGFKLKREAFGDRNYNMNLKLVSRNSINALITEPKAVFDHLLYMVKKNLVKTIDGEAKYIEAETYCIHGDTHSALQILAYLSKELPTHNIHLKK